MIQIQLKFYILNDLKLLSRLHRLMGILKALRGVAGLLIIRKDFRRFRDAPRDSPIFYTIPTHFRGKPKIATRIKRLHIPIDFGRFRYVYQILGGQFVSWRYAKNRPIYRIAKSIGRRRGFYNLSGDSTYRAENSALRNQISPRSCRILEYARLYLDGKSAGRPVATRRM